MSDITLSKKDIELLTKVFESDQISVKVQSVNRDKTKALLVLYAAHQDVANRLDEVDPEWAFDILEDRQLGGDNGVALFGRLTVKGITRGNIGDGYDYKAAASDCFKRCAMMFGIGRYLYDQEMVWVPYNESSDKFKQWSFAEYLAASGGTKPASRGASARKTVLGSGSSLPPSSGGSTPQGPVKGESHTGPVPPREPSKAAPAVGDTGASSDLGEYVITFGKHMGKKLRSFDTKELLSWVEFLEAKNKYPETAKKARAYLASIPKLSQMIAGLAAPEAEDSSMSEDDLPF